MKYEYNEIVKIINNLYKKTEEEQNNILDNIISEDIIHYKCLIKSFNKLYDTSKNIIINEIIETLLERKNKILINKLIKYNFDFNLILDNMSDEQLLEFKKLYKYKLKNNNDFQFYIIKRYNDNDIIYKFLFKILDIIDVQPILSLFNKKFLKQKNKIFYLFFYILNNCFLMADKKDSTYLIYNGNIILFDTKNFEYIDDDNTLIEFDNYIKLKKLNINILINIFYIFIISLKNNENLYDKYFQKIYENVLLYKGGNFNLIQESLNNDLLYLNEEYQSKMISILFAKKLKQQLFNI